MSSCFSSQPTKKEREAKDSGAAAPVITETQPITIAARRPGKVVRPLQKLCGRKKRQSWLQASFTFVQISLMLITNTT
jgi:hypothetical protein